MGADFSGYATKAGLKCTDGRTIMPDAFKHQDAVTVPLVWQHGHSTPDNVLGHAVLENRDDGVYAYGYFNETPQGKNAKLLVEHKDISFLSIYANQLVEKAKQVFHGMIREVSLVLAGANPGAKIDFVAVQHADGELETLSDEAVIYTGLVLEHEDKVEKVADKPAEEKVEETVEHSEEDPTVQEVFDSLTPVQQDVVHYMIGVAVSNTTASTSSTTTQHADTKAEGDLEHKEGTTVTKNVFEQNAGGGSTTTVEKHVLSHDDMKAIFADAAKVGSLKSAVESYALAHGIDSIDTLFPDPKASDATPDFDKRRTEWVAGVINGTRKSPFTRIKNFWADITEDEARAKGYIKGRLKKEEFFSVTKRTTGPTTVYKKQKLDRDDIIDITDFDVVSWMKGEMRLMLDEELARAILIGDGRDVSDEDKIKDPVGATDGLGIRSILNDHEIYVASVNVQLTDTAGTSGYGGELVDAIVSGMGLYKGTGTPDFYTTLPVITKILLTRDTLGRRLYRSLSDVAAELGVGRIIAVEVMEDEPTVVGILVNMADYTLGADRGGEISLFDFFDIDYNQFKYLIETRVSGALTKIRSAIVVREVAGDNALLAQPTAPTFVSSTGVVTIPTMSNVTYKNSDTSATLSAGAQSALAVGATLNVIAVANSGYAFPDNQHDQWSFTRP